MPTGVVGEICIAGAGVGASYLDRPELTQKRFVPDPFSRDPADRMFRTGDLARYTVTGELEFIGRNDTQVKIRGMRVELGEIESLLLGHPDIAACSVVPLQENAGSGGASSLGAYIVFRHTQNAEWRVKLASWLRSRLPGHMVPSRFAALERLPISANGKVDKHTLPAFATSDSILNTRSAAPLPMDAEELAVFNLCREFFPSIGQDPMTDFFDAGGHSLLAARLMSRFNERFGLRLPMRALFERPTIAGMASWLKQPGKDECKQDDSWLDVALDIKIQPSAARSVANFASPRTVLLTGASGFIGRHLLWQLLESTDATVYCLMRGGPVSELFDKQIAAIRETGRWLPGWADRLRILPGDLSADDLGLSDTDRRTIHHP